MSVTKRNRLSRLLEGRAITRHLGHARLFRLFIASVFVWSLLIPIAGMINDVSRYQLSAAAEKVLDKPNKNLSKKFTYNNQKRLWQFNKNGESVQAGEIAKQQGTDTQSVQEALSQLRKQVGGGGEKDESLYSADLPVNSKEGFVYYDNESSQSFTMVPNFEMQEGKLWRDRVVYPFGEGGQIVYTAKTNGLKEDIILNHFTGKRLEYSYTLKLPKTLEARLTEDGMVGIYSADISLFGKITYGSDSDRLKVQNARETAPKNHLLFAIPAPYIKDQNGKGSHTRYYLNDNTLRIIAEDLDTLTYPLTLDPSVVITSSSDFATGNNEGSIEYGTANQIERAEASGGTIGSFTTDNTAAWAARMGHGSVAYNGYLYMVGGHTGTNLFRSDAYYAPLNSSNGSIGTWTATSSINTARTYVNMVVYNGYLYVYAGYNNTTGSLGSVEYAKINSDGSLSAWTTSSNAMSLAVCRSGFTVYNGYIYATGGSNVPASMCGNSSTASNTVQFAKLKANGDTEAWQTTTSYTGVLRMSHTNAAYNGYMYITSGTEDGGVATWNDILYAPINSDGTIPAGSWTLQSSGSNYPTDQYRHSYGVYNGYLYTNGGDGGETGVTYYAKLNASGLTSKPVATVSKPSPVWGHAMAFYNGYMYLVGGTGTVTGGVTNMVEYTKINPTGMNAHYSSETATGTSTTSPTNINLGRASGSALAYKGCLYLIGGNSGSGGGVRADVYYSAISSTNTLGTWARSANTMNFARSGFGFAFYDNRVYAIGGSDGTNATSDVQYATVNTSGCGIGSWTTNATSYHATISNHPAIAYNGYIYQLGDNGNDNNKVYSAPISSTDGSVGSWTQQNSMPVFRANEYALAHGKYMYVLGGQTGAAASDVVTYAELTSSGGLGSWSTANSMITARRNHEAVVYNGYIYTAGGDDMTNALDSVEYAKINADGSLGTWTAGSPLTNAQSFHQMAISGDKVFLISGRTGLTSGSGVRNVYSFRINSGGSGNNSSWGTNATNFTNQVAYHGSFASGGYLFTVAGYDGSSYTANTYSAPINSDGTVGSWTAQTSLNTSRGSFAIATYNGYVYAYSGVNGTGRLNTYEYASIGSGGVLGSWTQGTMNLSSGSVSIRSAGAGAVYNGYLYLMGGRDNSSFFNDVYYAPLNSNGSVGTWAATNSFTTARANNAGFAYNGYLYILGGRDASSNYFLDVQYAPINGNGTVGSWAYTTSLSTSIGLHTAVAANGVAYVWGGTNPAGNQNFTSYSRINSNGTLGEWRVNGFDMPATRANVSGVYYGGYLYLVGGTNGAGLTYYNTIYYSALDITAKKSYYSKLIDFGAPVNFASAYYNGTLSPNSSIQYRTASSNGILSSLSSAIAGSGSEPTPDCNAGSVQYVWMLVSMDDTETATVGGGSSTTNLTDVAVYYKTPQTPPPNLRLFGGKWFYNETQQALDTCKI